MAWRVRFRRWLAYFPVKAREWPSSTPRRTSMSEANTIPHGHSPQAKRAFGILFVTVAIASLLTATVLSNSQPTVEGPAAAPVVPVAAAASPGTGVPDASTVFDGKGTPEEVTAPTF